MPTLVTGAAGFAGSHLIDLLAREGGDVVAWHRPGGRPPFTAPQTRWQAVDLLDREDVRRAVAECGPETVYHCAGAAHAGRSWSEVERTLALNVRATHFLLDALRRVQAPARVLLPSSAMVYRPSDEPLTEEHATVPPSPYGLSKLAQEQLGIRALGDGIMAMIARPFNHIGPRQDASYVASSFARQIVAIENGRAARELAVGNLAARRDLTDVRDTVRAYTMILQRGVAGRPYNVCSGRAIAISDLLDLLLSRAQVKVTVRVDPARCQQNDLPRLVGDPARARDEIGWRPEIPLERTADDLLQYWRDADAGGN